MNWQIIVGGFLFIGGLGNLTEDFGAFLFGVLIGGCLLYWGLRKKGILKKPVPQAKQDRSLKVESFRAVGVNYYADNIKNLATSNPAWKSTAKQLLNDGKVNKKVFRYNFLNKPVKLIPEPENSHDENAILVQIAGEKVGYISRDENIHVKELLDRHEIKYISSFISGGEYKYANENGDLVHDELGITIDVKIGYV